MEPIGHCPFVGLKQNRAIRFSSPTPEHRCYIEGQAIEIPVDQEFYCLSHNHVQCPLYTGLRTATTQATPLPAPVPGNQPASPIPGWFGTLSPRDRLVYALMLGLLAAVVAIYLFSGVQSLIGLPDISARTATAQSTSQIVAINPTATLATTPIRPSSTVLPSLTALPTSVPTQRPTERPTRAAVFFPPTSTPLPATTIVPTSSAAGSTTAPASTNQPQATSGAQTGAATAQPAATGLPATSHAQASTIPATSTPRPAATQRPAATRVPATSTPRQAATQRPAATRVPATSTPRPAATRMPASQLPTATPKPVEPTAVPPTAVPPTAIPPTAVPPTAVPPTAVPPPVAERTNEVLWLYFGDTTGTLFVPVQRQVSVENKQVARAAVQALIAGPRNGLTAVLDPAAQIVDIRIDNGTAIVNFDRNPILDGRGRDALALTLTHFSSIQRIQIQVQGQNLEGPRARPVVNPINPLGLPVDYDQTAFLPVYFISVDGSHQVRMIRMIPKTYQTAEGTVRALLEGPGKYDYALRRVIPAATELRGISIENGIVNVDLTQPFADAEDRKAAARTLTASLTTLPNVQGVRILVEGKLLSDYWGEGYGGVFKRPVINGE